MKKLLIPLFFFFLIASAIPAYAYLDIDTNVTYTGGLINNQGIVCTNNTGTFYCYHFAENGATHHMIVERYNATWGDLKTCDTGAVGAYAQAYWRNPAVANTTHLIVPHYSSGSGGYRLIPIWNMTDSATCTSTDTLGTGDQLFNSSSSVLYGGGYYNIDSNNASVWVYWGDINGIRNSTDNTWLSIGFWGTDKSLRLPDQADNTTIYGYDIANLPYQLRKYIGGAFSSNSGNVTQLWGLGFNNWGWDVWEETLNTTWLYAFDGTFFYRVNLTEGEALGASWVQAVYPINDQTVGSQLIYEAIIHSNNSGTIGWYVDRVHMTNQSFTPNANGSTFVYYAQPTTLTDGYHNWSLEFYPNNEYNFTSGIFQFIMSAGYAGDGVYTGDTFTDAKTYLDEVFGSENGGYMTAFLVASMISMLFWWYSGHKKFEVFIVPLLIILGIFSLVGLFPTWFLFVQVMLVAMFIFFKVKGL